MIESLETAILLVDGKGNVSYLNSSAQSLFNSSLRQVKGQTLQSLFFKSEALVRAVSKTRVEMASFTERGVDITFSSPLKRIKVDCTFSPYTLDSDERCVLVELRRVDRMLRIEREERRLAQQNAVKQLVRGLAHEVKNPLGGLRGAAQLLERELESEDLKEFTDIIIGEADRLQQLVDDMLGPNQLPRRAKLNIHQVLERVRSLMEIEGGSQVRIVRDYDPSIPEIIADKDRLIQAILNVVRNAIQAIGESGRVVIRTRPLRRFTLGNKTFRLVLKIEINDNGPGIPDDIADQIFYPMVTSKASGTGLGLSITQTIIGQHSGLIECTSEPGDTTFTILLPFLEEDMEEEGAALTAGINYAK